MASDILASPDLVDGFAALFPLDFMWPCRADESNLKIGGQPARGMRRLSMLRNCCAAFFLPHRPRWDPAPHKPLGIVTVLRVSLPQRAIVTDRLPCGAVSPGGF